MSDQGREQAKQQVVDTFLASENARLRAERDELDQKLGDCARRVLDLQNERESLSFQLAKARLEHQQAERELDTYEKADDAALAEARAEVARLKVELERANEGGAAILLAKLTSMPEDLAAVLAERDEAREDAAHWRFHADQYVRVLAECEEVLGRASDADVASHEQLVALADEARELGERLAAWQVAENAARLDEQ